MKRAQTEKTSRRVQAVLDKVRKIPNISGRIQSISHEFLGYPYIVNPLIGSANLPEIFTSSTDGFDCVTYVETILALACSRRVADFVPELTRIRYSNERVDWRFRNHYMTDWIRSNVSQSLIRRVHFKAPMRIKERVLNVVPGLPPRKQRFSCTPKQLLAKVSGSIVSGDFIFFASARPHFDIFHCGIMIRDGERLLLRHASKSQGGVVEQPLFDFLNRNRMAGVIVVRPVDRGRE